MSAIQRIILFLILLAFLMPGWLSIGADSGALSQVEITVNGVLGLLRDPSISHQDRRQQITALIKQRFDFEAMSQGTLGVNWKRANAEEKARFKELFSQLLEETYMGRIEAYTNETVEYLKEEVRDGRAVVETQVVTSSVNIPITYKLLPKGDEWLVYDVIIEGVSLIRNFRSSYGDIVRSDGIDGLLKQMSDKVAELKANNQKGA